MNPKQERPQIQLKKINCENRNKCKSFEERDAEMNVDIELRFFLRKAKGLFWIIVQLTGLHHVINYSLRQR